MGPTPAAAMPHTPTALLTLAALALAVAALPLAWWAWQQRGARPVGRLAGLTALTLFLTFDLIVFGAFTRLTDSGLGCPDWPGCYGQAHPVAASAPIQAEQAARPGGPVTEAKAWIEMIHRYLAMAVGVLIVTAVWLGWHQRGALPHSPAWSWATLAWVILQGLFGRWTVTWKLYPAVVTVHLLGAMVLLLLLVLQHESFRQRPLVARGSGGIRLGPAAVWLALAVVLGQVALGGWVSTNYAVLACGDFPTCQGRWWPLQDGSALAQGFTLRRELGHAGDGSVLRFESLVAIHFVHRLGAVLVTAVLGLLAWRLHRAGLGRHARALLGLLLLQLGSGLSNVVLGWPILAALLHSAGAAALVGVLASLGAWLTPALTDRARLRPAPAGRLRAPGAA